MKKFLLGFVLLLIVATPAIVLTGCGTTHVNGFYVRAILFGFSEDQQRLIYEGELTREDAAKNLFAQNNDTRVTRPFWGTGGVFEEMSGALRDLTGQSALNVFNQFLDRYNDDPGMVNNQNGYLIPLGDSWMVAEFDHLARRVFGGPNLWSPAECDFNPHNSIGNAFIGDQLGYAITDFGIHIVMVSGLSTR